MQHLLLLGQRLTVEIIIFFYQDSFVCFCFYIDDDHGVEPNGR